MYLREGKLKNNKCKAVLNVNGRRKVNPKTNFCFVGGRKNVLQLFGGHEDLELRKMEGLLRVEHQFEQDNNRLIPTGIIPFEGDPNTTTESFTDFFEQMLRNGIPISLTQLMAIIPQNTIDTWVPGERIREGFKYEFNDSEGIRWVVRGHAPEIARANHGEIGTLFWTVRVQRGDEHLLSEEVPINQDGSERSYWVRNLRNNARVRLAHIVATPA